MVNGTGLGDISGEYTTKYYFSYNDDDANVATYGRLYTWAAATNGISASELNPGEVVRGGCPTGWHVPTDEEWIELEMYLGMSKIEASKTAYRGTDELMKLKESGKSHWRGYYALYLGTNESGFTALPAGGRKYNGSFEGISGVANFWSATGSLSSFAWCRRLYDSRAGVYRHDDYKTRGYSVRCVKDSD